MKCEHSWRQSYKSYKKGVHIATTLYCEECGEFKDVKGTGEEISTKKLDDTDRRLNQAVRTGKAHGKNINNIRSYMKNGKWNYKYL